MNFLIPDKTSELLTCPFCGGEIEIVCIGGGWFWRHKNDPTDISCIITHSQKFCTREEVEEIWNTRKGQ